MTSSWPWCHQWRRKQCSPQVSMTIFPELGRYANIFITRCVPTQITKFMGSTWGPYRSCWPQMGPMLAPWNLLSGKVQDIYYCISFLVPYHHTIEMYSSQYIASICVPIFGHHDDVIKWKPFLRYWTSVWGIHRSPGRFNVHLTR